MGSEMCIRDRSINVQKMFKVILSRVFDLKCTLEKLVEVGEPLLIF